ncbi:MAG: class I SAM-dependent methyltransferase [Eubacteriales bacterium]|nr:class I SAM-dependent methyltransferase [Eubacteriales bacterium]MDD4476449.1 class I SAM-dependent methyltransferase [Eubacteriales bacterium]
MFKAEGWKDYKLIDASGGERLESWGGVRLIRPDPQVIWNTDKDSVWNSVDGVYRRSAKGGGEWVLSKAPKEWVISCDNLKFAVSLMGFKHTGVFPEQKANWDWFVPIIKKAVSEGRKPKVLNLFAYTGCASVAAAKAGAFVCHVDASKGIIAKAKRNAELSGLPNDGIRYITDDCLKFIEREIRRGNKYDAIIMDPPSYGRGSSGEVWKMEDMADELVSKSAVLLSEKPLFFLLNSYTTGLSPATTAYIVEIRVAKPFGGNVSSDELGLVVEKTGLVLPCGAAARVTFN